MCHKLYSFTLLFLSLSCSSSAVGFCSPCAVFSSPNLYHIVSPSSHPHHHSHAFQHFLQHLFNLGFGLNVISCRSHLVFLHVLYLGFVCCRLNKLYHYSPFIAILVYPSPLTDSDFFFVLFDTLIPSRHFLDIYSLFVGFSLKGLLAGLNIGRARAIRTETLYMDFWAFFLV